MQTSFLQSEEWRRIQELYGRFTARLCGSLIIRHNLPAQKNYLYSPWPSWSSEASFKNFMEEAEVVGREQHSIFLKIEPYRILPRLPQKTRFVLSNSLQPQKTVVVDLAAGEERLLSGFHEKTRYNIRLALRHGVTVYQPRSSDAFKIWWQLLGQTAKREKFYTHTADYYEKLLAVRSDQFSNELFFVEYGGRVLAAALVNFYVPSRTATYLHGASLRDNKEVMAPHLLHWKIMLNAKDRGLNFYDFGGIDETRWPGVTRFKLGFGGEALERSGAVDIIYRPLWYKVYQVARRIF